MRRSRALVAAVITAAIVLGNGAMPAGASQPGAGGVEFLVTAHLPTFPCRPPGCTGTFEGMSTGTLAGEDDSGIHWSVAWTGGQSQGSFSYVDSCDVPAGIAAGGGNLTASVGAVTGTYGEPAPGAPFPLPVIGVNTGLTFEWTRIGLSAVLITRVSVSITVVKPEGIVTIPVVDDHLGAANAQFAPTGPASTCAAPQPLDAVVLGTNLITT